MGRPLLNLTTRIAPLAVAYSHSKGLDARQILKQHELPTDLDWKSAGRVEWTLTSPQLKALLDQLSEALQAQHLGLDLAQSAQVGLYGVGEFLARSAASVREACANAVRFNALVAPSQQFRFETGPTESALIHSTMPGAEFSRHLNEYTSAILAKRFLTYSKQACLRRVWFAHAPPSSTERLAQEFGTSSFEFNHSRNGFAFDSALLDEPVRTGDSALFAFLEENALAALANRPKMDDLSDRLRHEIREALKHGEPNVERIATRLALSGRTLQRRLSGLGTSFQVMLDDVRFDLARAYLKDDRLDVTQVAYLLGYSELRAFDRAFRRWAKTSPREWRSQATTR